MKKQMIALASLLLWLTGAAYAQSLTVEKYTIAQVQDGILHHQFTCEQFIAATIERIKQYDLSAASQAPINAITEINRSALDNARAIDEQYAITGRLAGTLHCVPVVLKENLDSYDTTTTAGSYALLGNQPVRDAFLTAQLRQAGAIILAKGGMDEFAWGMLGISSRNGRMGNPYDTTKNPGGSSGGPAAAANAGFTLAAIGSDNSGSVLIPSAFNGLVGLRPSTGLISQRGMFPMGSLDGVAGPLMRNVTDLAKVLDVIAKPDKNDKKTLGIKRPATYTTSLKEDGLQGKRIGIIRQVGESNIFHHMPVDVSRLFQQSYTNMQNQGAVIIPDLKLEKFNVNREYNQAGEVTEINQYLASYPAARKSFQDICQSDRTRNFGNVQKCLAFMHKIQGQTTREYNQVLAIFKKNRAYVEKFMDDNRLDALLVPITTNGGPTYDTSTITAGILVSSNAGLPAITFNIGYRDTDHMPVGYALISRQFAEPALIEIAYAYEKHYPTRTAPVMPAPEKALRNISAAGFNNLVSELGKNAYDQVLKNGKKEDLSAKIFQKITVAMIHDLHPEKKPLVCPG